MKKLTGLLCVLGLISGAAATWASSPSGVTATVLSRVTFEPFKVKTDSSSPIDFQAKSKSDMDVVIRKHDYVANSSTGWHMHPGPVFITVVSGQLTFYRLRRSDLHGARGDRRLWIRRHRPGPYREERDQRAGAGHLGDPGAGRRRIPQRTVGAGSLLALSSPNARLYRDHRGDGNAGHGDLGFLRVPRAKRLRRGEARRRPKVQRATPSGLPVRVRYSARASWAVVGSSLRVRWSASSAAAGQFERAPHIAVQLAVIDRLRRGVRVLAVIVAAPSAHRPPSAAELRAGEPRRCRLPRAAGPPAATAESPTMNNSVRTAPTIVGTSARAPNTANEVTTQSRAADFDEARH